MKSLQELCALTIMKSTVRQTSGTPWRERLGDKTRCACNFYDDYYMNELIGTEEFIYLLPLPETVKEYLNEVSKKICDNHRRIYKQLLDLDKSRSECESYCDGDIGCSYCCDKFSDVKSELERLESSSESSEEEEDSHDDSDESADEEEKESSEETDGQSDMGESITNPSQDDSERESEPEEEKRNSEQESDLQEDMRNLEQDGANVNTLQELCARTILKLRLQQWPGPSGAVVNGWSVSKCTCYNCAKEFIEDLPLPEIVQKFVENLYLKKRGQL